MLFFGKRKENSETKTIQMVKTNTLKVTLKSGIAYSWSVDEFKYTIEPWKDFYKWFFCRDGSEFFIMKYEQGETMIRKSDIATFNVNISTRMKIDNFW